VVSKNKDISKFLSETIRSGVTNQAVTNNDVPSGIDIFTTLDSLPISGLIAGQEAFVEENSRIYVSNGSGWYNTGSNVPFSPTWFTEPDASYSVVDSATPLIITAKAQDSDNPNLANLSFGTDSAQYMVSISNDSSVFTFTPKSADSIGIEVAAGNLTDSNGDFIYTFKWSDGFNFVTKAATISYSPAGGGGGWWNRALFTGFPSGNAFAATRGVVEATSGDFYQLGQEANNTYLIKYNSTGSAQWGRSLNGNAYYARPKSVTADSTSAYTVSSDYGYGENMSGYPDPQLALAIKWSSAGAITWAKIIKPTTTTTNYDYFTPEPGGGQLDSSGNLWVLGTSRRGGSGAVGSQQLRDTSIRKFYIAKLNGSTGALMGMWKLNSNTDEQASDQSIVIDGDDNIYVCGAQYRDHTGYGFPHMLIAKFNSSMVFQWRKMLGQQNSSNYYDVPYVVRVDSNNNPYFIGYTDNGTIDSTPVLFKLNKSNGSLMWGKTAPDASGHIGLVIDDDDNLWVLSRDKDDLPQKYVIRKYSTDGTIQNQYGIDTTVSNYQFYFGGRPSLDMTSDGSLLINSHHYYSPNFEQAPIKMPVNILEAAGTYGDLVISSQTATDGTYSPNTFTFITYSVVDVGSSFETVNYNTGSYAIEPIVSLTLSSENLDTIP
jgi:hypothetical protein